MSPPLLTPAEPAHPSRGFPARSGLPKAAAGSERGRLSGRARAPFGGSGGPGRGASRSSGPASALGSQLPSQRVAEPSETRSRSPGRGRSSLLCRGVSLRARPSAGPGWSVALPEPPERELDVVCLPFFAPAAGLLSVPSFLSRVRHASHVPAGVCSLTVCVSVAGDGRGRRSQRRTEPPAPAQPLIQENREEKASLTLSLGLRALAVKWVEGAGQWLLH